MVKKGACVTRVNANMLQSKAWYFQIQWWRYKHPNFAIFLKFQATETWITEKWQPCRKKKSVCKYFLYFNLYWLESLLALSEPVAEIDTDFMRQLTMSTFFLRKKSKGESPFHRDIKSIVLLLLCFTEVLVSTKKKSKSNGSREIHSHFFSNGESYFCLIICRI